MRRRVSFIVGLFIALSIVITIASCALWNCLMHNNESFRNDVSGYVAKTSARVQIALLQSYATLDEAKAAVAVEKDSVFIDDEHFSMFGAYHYIVREHDGWKIENTFQFCHGHEGITESDGKHEFIARKVQNQWCICITFFDESIQSYNLDGQTISVDIIGDQERVNHKVLFSVCSDGSKHELHIEQSNYVLLNNAWECHVGQK